jgi:DNA polymerase-3 subunit epsilon
MTNRKLTGESLHLLIHPQRDIPIEASNIHGITLDKLKDAPAFEAVAAQIASFLKDSTLIIHNANFDVGFLDAEFARCQLPPVKSLCAGVIDTLALAKSQFPGKRNSLDALCDRFNINRKNRVYHGALIDCELLADVYIFLTSGQDALIMAPDQISPDTDDAVIAMDNGAALMMQNASESEEAHHRQYRENLAKDNKGLCIWSRYIDQP